MTITLLVRALRLPFTTASALPFILGTVLAASVSNPVYFWIGLVAVVAGHLGANLINDYADSKSGADWHDKRSYAFFGGSKLIQEGALTERTYLLLATFFSGIALAGVALLTARTGDLRILLATGLVVLLSWAYSMRPFALSYRRLGEPVIFVLFGPVPVLAGYYLQTGALVDGRALLASLPLAFLTTAILYANEIPDRATDLAADKHTWANSLPGASMYVGYLALSLLGIGIAAFLVLVGVFPLAALAAVLALPIVFKASGILRRSYLHKETLVASAKLAILAQTVVAAVLILAVAFAD